MKIFTRVVRSVRRQGVYRTLVAAQGHAAYAISRHVDRGLDVIRGTDTTRIIEARDLMVTSVHKKHAVRYEPTRPRAFRALIAALGIPPGEVLVDLGSGKGRVLMLGAALGFKRVVGVEFVPRLCEVARRNVDLMRRRGHPATPVAIHCCDAADYPFDDDETVIYLFNPFTHVVLGKVLDHLSASLRRSPRRAWLIYGGCRHFVGPTGVRDAITACGMFNPAGDYVYGVWDYAAFIHVPG